MLTSDLTFLVPPHFSRWLQIRKVGTLIITMMMSFKIGFRMDQLIFWSFRNTPLVLQIWFFCDFVWFHWSYHPSVLQFYSVSQTFEAFAVSSFCKNLNHFVMQFQRFDWLSDLVAKYLNPSPLYITWSIFLKKTVIPVKPFGCKRLWPTHCCALHQSAFLLPTTTMPKLL